MLEVDCAGDVDPAQVIRAAGFRRGNTDMWTSEHGIETTAAPEAIWRLWSDVPRWPEWNADLERSELSGPFAAGSVITMTPHGQEPIELRIADLQINLLRSSAAGELVEPAGVGAPDSGSRVLLTITVDDVDAVCAELERRGVRLLNGPIDRPWGVRTAAFADPAGHTWEIAT